MLSFDNYKIDWLPKADKQFGKLDKPIREKILDKLDLLFKNTELVDFEKLKGYQDLYRLKWGDYRIILEVNQRKKTIIVAEVGHRKEVYRSLKVLAFLFGLLN